MSEFMGSNQPIQIYICSEWLLRLFEIVQRIELENFDEQGRNIFEINMYLYSFIGFKACLVEVSEVYQCLMIEMTWEFFQILILKLLS